MSAKPSHRRIARQRRTALARALPQRPAYARLAAEMAYDAKAVDLLAPAVA